MNTPVSHPYSSMPTKGFALAPFKALHSGGANEWWYVANAGGFNCLQFENAPGVKFTSESQAKEIAESFNRVYGGGDRSNQG